MALAYNHRAMFLGKGKSVTVYVTRSLLPTGKEPQISPFTIVQRPCKVHFNQNLI